MRQLLKRVPRAARIVVLAGVLGVILLGSGTAWAQTTSNGSIAGVVKDPSGAVMPGVTVEAASPALIEKVKAAVTDGQGEYRIVELRPGPYTVTFTLPGFSTVKREGVELTSGFTATVNAELKVGSLEESILVSAETPLVDVQNTNVQQVLASKVIQEIPSSRGFSSFVTLTPGVRADPRATDVGGTQNDNAQAGTVWGGRSGEFRVLIEGLPTYGTGQARGIFLNAATADEFNVSLGGANAETEWGGMIINLVPKQGGNDFTGFFLVNGTGGGLQSNNLTSSLQAQGLTNVGTVQKIWDTNATLGGPFLKDKLWFFAAARYWGSDKYVADNYVNAAQGMYLGAPNSGVVAYVPDRNNQTVRNVNNRDFTGRLTWQISPRNKLSIEHIEEKIDFLYAIDFTPIAPEAASRYDFNPDTVTQLTWSSPVTSKLLLQAGAQYFNYHYKIYHSPGVSPNDITLTELSTGFTYGASPTYGNNPYNMTSSRVSASYISGSHAFKAGIQTQSANTRSYFETDRNVTYSFLRGVPTSITERGTPYFIDANLKLNLGLYAQDQWTLKRLTLNGGLRFDYLNENVPAQTLPATQFLPARSYDAVNDVPNWKDLNIRLGGAYDLFGNGKTAVKGSIGRYGVVETQAIATAANPVSTVVNSVSRTWNDANGNYVPDCDLNNPAANGECGAVNNNTFGQSLVTTRYSNQFINGFGVRPYNWLALIELQHQLLPGVSVHADYARRWYGNFPATVNQAVDPTNFSPYSITVPVDSRLPGGGGYAITGLYDVNPSSFGHVNNLVTQASNYSTQTEVSNFFDITVNARFHNGALVSGAFDIGHTETNNCNVVMNNPQIRDPFVANLFGTGSSPNGQATGEEAPRMQSYCDIVTPWSAQTQFKLLGVYPLPWNSRVSANLVSFSGPPEQALQAVPNAQIAPSLGRNLSAGANGTVLIDLIPPETLFEPRINQLDIRLSKILKIGRTTVEGQFDMYNALNASPVLAFNTTYGPSWLKPIQVLDGRVLKFGLQVTF
jgi:hypothetical protein